MSENSSRITFKDQVIWTSSGCRDLVLLLLLQESALPQYHPEGGILQHYLLKNLSVFYDTELDTILSGTTVADQLEKMLSHIDETIGQSTKKSRDDWWQQLVGIYLRNNPGIDKKKAGRALQELPDIGDPAVTTLLRQLRRLIKGEYIFDTVTDLTIAQLCGTWQSVSVKDTPQYDINFNMLDDISPQNEPIRLSVQASADTFTILVEIPVYNWAARQSDTLDWLVGTTTVKDGCLHVSYADGRIYNIPILKMELHRFETFLFRTHIIFEKITS
ncbi:hypothetical protein [Chitinophaga pinensis]|uniref:Uncharacterized protein n=1 Tax=Chitinophaga pinensis TaxID=79329 RepID=A0A5C6LTI2_9BACT|nr:hypothetical protein [Chitinophaga pinensis]TWV99809.1 hypothetical protein FEF09_13975 [Chitinophaga pinensis]